MIDKIDNVVDVDFEESLLAEKSDIDRVIARMDRMEKRLDDMASTLNIMLAQVGELHRMAEDANAIRQKNTLPTVKRDEKIRVPGLDNITQGYLHRVTGDG